MVATQFNLGNKILGNWTLVRLLGEGSYGRVFEAEREDFGVTYKSAIKIITIPQSQDEIKSVRADGMDDDSVTSYFRSVVEEIVKEFELMARLKGTSNIVSYEDHAVIKHEDGIGWDILIRMELLTPLLDYSIKHSFTRQTITKLGIDMCRALELCQKFNIIHRDIKPGNIFASELGDYKLGDFGIARTVDKTTGGLGKKGTYDYMAPEVYREEAYGSRVDIYSLGIVMFKLLNDNRIPFLPEYPAKITYNDQEAARAKRISGATLPMPKNADGRLAEIVLKACAYSPNDRYSSPLLMRQELEAIMYSCEEAPIIYPQGDEAPIKSIEYINSNKQNIYTDSSNNELTDSIFGNAANIDDSSDLFDTQAELEPKSVQHDVDSDVTQPSDKPLTENHALSQEDKKKLLEYSKTLFTKNDPGLYKGMFSSYCILPAAGITSNDFLGVEKTLYDNALIGSTKYAKISPSEQVLFIVDFTLFGGGKKGMVITNEAIYWKDNQPKKCSLSDVLSIELASNNEIAINNEVISASSVPIAAKQTIVKAIQKVVTDFSTASAINER